MKKNALLVLSLLTVNLSSAQLIDFVLADPQPDLIEVYGGSFASGDIDGDGDQDLIMAGLDPGRETALYLNDGNGNFTEVLNIPFPEASDTVSIFEDLDLDGDLDLFFSGNGSSIGKFTHIYLNDGSGVFIQLANPDLPEFAGRGAAIGDIDNDGDSDLLISALDANNQFVADVYFNDGNANFTASGNSDFTPVKFASIAFIDAENDGDADVIISGTQANDTALTRLYLNDGSGNYSIDPNTNFEQLSADDIDVADTDNDGDQDILMSGTNDLFEVSTILYINDGDGQFTELSTDLQNTFAGTNAIADLDNDGDQDILIIGSQAGGLPNIYNIVYENLGNNSFNQVDTIGGEYIAACVIDDFNGDGLADIIIQGFVDNTNVYWNNTKILDIPETKSEVHLTMYPNPANHILYINASELIRTVSLYTVLGQKVSSTQGSGFTMELDISHQSSGNYFAKVETDNSVKVIKLIKK
jgi:Secretion system C-terminal sorting domain/FG-GAP-like repeat